jgi:hypothetical protein
MADLVRRLRKASRGPATDSIGGRSQALD